MVPIVAATIGAAAKTATKVIRIRDCTKAKVRPRISLLTSIPSMVKPVTQQIPLNAPRITTIKIEITRLAISARRIKKKPAIAREAPNKRRRENCANIFGPKPIPSARPVKTAAKSTPYAASPPPRSPTNVRASPMTAPAAENAPTMPTISPRIIFEDATAFQPCTRDFPMFSSFSLPDAGPLGISLRPRITQAA